MKLVLSKKDFLSGLGRVATVPARKGLVPSLSAVLLTASAATDTLRISATDLVVSVEVVIPATSKSAGSAAVSCKDMMDRVKAMPDGPISLAFDEKNRRCTISAPGSARKFVLAYVGADDYPKLPAAPWKESSALSTGHLRKLIGSTEHALGRDITRPHLASMLVVWDGNTITASATDGHRCARRTLEIGATSQARKLLIPAKACAELSRALESVTEPEEMFEIEQVGSRAHFRCGNWEMSSLMTDASFPPLDHVIPKSTKHTVSANRVSLIDAIKSVRLAADAAGGGVVFTLSNGECVLTSESSDHGSATDTLPCDYSSTTPTAVCINHEYAADALESLDGETVTLGISGELDPVLFKPAESDSGLALVMPMRK